MEEDLKILERRVKDLKLMFALTNPELKAIENLINRVKELEEENKKLKELDQAMTYMLQDLEVEKKGWTIEEMKRAYL